LLTAAAAVSPGELLWGVVAVTSAVTGLPVVAGPGDPDDTGADHRVRMQRLSRRAAWWRSAAFQGFTALSEESGLEFGGALTPPCAV
jgi:hypothetical protein